jgi:hypothetical protein
MICRALPLYTVRAGRANVLAAVATRDAQNAAGFAGGVVDGGALAGSPVDGVDPAGQAHRVSAVAGRGQLLLPAAAKPRRRSACFDRAVPARQGDQIAAAIYGHQPGGLGKRRQIKIYRNGRDRPRFEDTSPAHPPNLTGTFRRPSQATERRPECVSVARQRSAGDRASRSR